MKKINYFQLIGLFCLINPLLFVSADDVSTEISEVIKGPKKNSLVTAEPERVVIDAYPGGDAWSRNTMTGNWGGKRQELADKGIFINMDLTQVVQGFTGGLGGKTRYTGSADLWFNFDTGRLGWWSGGLITLHTEGLWGNGGNPISVNEFTGSIAPVNFDATMPGFNENSVALSEYYLTQAVTEEVKLVVGQIDIAELVDENVFANSERSQFLNGALKNNLMLGMYAPYTAFTFATEVDFTEDISLAVAVLSPGGDAVNQYEDFFKDVTVASELDFAIKPVDLPGNIRLGFLWTSQEKINTDHNPRVIIPALITGEDLPTSDSNWMINFNFDQYLYRANPGSSSDTLHTSDFSSEPQGIGIFGRVAYGGSAGNIINVFGSFGVGGRGLIPTRENDRYGIGWYYMGFPDNFKSVARLQSENGIEAFYNFAITPWAQLTADVQWISPAQKAAENVWAFGGRLQLYF